MDPIELLKHYQGDMSQTEFAERIGISQSLLSSVYTGQRAVTVKILLNLARAFPEAKPVVLDIFFVRNNNNCDDNITDVMAASLTAPCAEPAA